MGIYIVDSNFFIQAHRSSYPLDIFPAYWKKISQLAEEGKIISIDKVKNEIYGNNDDLESWCIENLPVDFFKDSTAVLKEYGQVASWAYSLNSHYLPRALDEFLDADEADAWIVSYALANGITIVTQELSDPQRKNKVKIPDVCLAFRVRFINMIEMFRELGERF